MRAEHRAPRTVHTWCGGASHQSRRWHVALVLAAGMSLGAHAWMADNGDGTYRNPILFADYSDPDVVAVGDDFYLIASDFHFTPGIPVLHSRDLVNWHAIGYVYPRLTMSPRYDTPGPQGGYAEGCWAPSIRYHDRTFWVYFCTPSEGLYLSTAAHPAGPWSPLIEVRRVAGWEDPCPFWDDDGTAYLARSVIGGGPAIIHRMTPDGTRLLDEGTTVYLDLTTNPVLEGLKVHKRNGFYYIWAPAGGVEHGWQTVLRSTSIWGPYEARRVLERGSTDINGPHQGGYIETSSGDGWFLHFQARGSYGRIPHLQPVRWENDWPVIGTDFDGNGVGEPVPSFRKPVASDRPSAFALDGSDEFDAPTLGLQWQWNHNPRPDRWSLTERPGYLRLRASRATSLHDALNTLTQKIVSPATIATAEIDTRGMEPGCRAGICVFTKEYAWVGVVCLGKHIRVVAVRYAGEDEPEIVFNGPKFPREPGTVHLRITVDAAEQATFAYGSDGTAFTPIGERVAVKPAWWKGAKLGIFHYHPSKDIGFFDVNRFHCEHRDR